MEVVAMMFGYGSQTELWQVVLMWAGLVAFIGLLIWVAYVLLAGADGRSGPRRHSARDVLDQRLANGEIDAEKYSGLRDLIASDADTPAHTPVGR
jgi:uncharacterized membrane protein